MDKSSFLLKKGLDMKILAKGTYIHHFMEVLLYHETV